MLVVMTGVTLAPSVVVFIGGIFVTLIGIIYRLLKSRVDDIEDTVADNSDDIESMKYSLYGNTDDPHDGGYAEIIDSNQSRSDDD